MKRLVSLIVKNAEVKGLEVVKKANQFLVSGFIESNQEFISLHRKKSSPAVVTLDYPVFIKSVSLRKDQLKNKRTIEDSILHRPPFSLKDSKWNYKVFGSRLTLFVVKSKDVEKTLFYLDSLNVTPVSLTCKASSLYNYFVFNYPKEKESFAFLYLTGELLDILVFHKTKFFLYEMPFESSSEGSVLATITKELRRITEYLQFQEAVPKESFSEIFICGKIEEPLVSKISEELKIKLSIFEINQRRIKFKAKDKNLEEFKEQLPVLLGASLGVLEKGLLNIDFIEQDRYKNLWNAYKQKFLKVALLVSTLSLVFLVGAAAFLLNSIIINRTAVDSQEKITNELIPVYRELNLKKESLLKQIEPLEKEVVNHRFLVEAVSLIDRELGDIEVERFDFVKEEDWQINLDIKSPSYDDISQFLRDLRESGYFTQIVPVSSRSESTREIKEAIYFKIKLIKK
ncbi:MAG: hypothetical protein JW734_01690 [Candidatus Omnitrophica bacterium]|nr:hypothetical protein [Candidatus Omnitrophota bacterium]